MDAVRSENIDTVASLIAGSKALTVVTGAGVSAESGIPTFRDALEGLWSRYRPEELATPEAFARDPEVVTRWYDERRSRCAGCEPNPGHHALVELERRITGAGGRFVLLTQNVDRLHQRAGSQRVVELHGSLWLWRCTSCGEEREEPNPPFEDYPPRCECGGARRPGVVWFGEMLPAQALDQAYRASQSCDVFLSVGTSAVVEPAASFVRLAAERGATTIEINLQPTPISTLVDHSLHGKSGELLPRLIGELDA